MPLCYCAIHWNVFVFASLAAAVDSADAPLYLPYKALVSTISSMVFSEGEAHRLIEILSEKAGIIQDTWHMVWDSALNHEKRHLFDLAWVFRYLITFWMLGRLLGRTTYHAAFMCMFAFSGHSERRPSGYTKETTGREGETAGSRTRGCFCSEEPSQRTRKG